MLNFLMMSAHGGVNMDQKERQENAHYSTDSSAVPSLHCCGNTTKIVALHFCHKVMVMKLCVVCLKPVKKIFIPIIPFNKWPCADG